MSAQQWFNEVEAVVDVLSGWVNEHDPVDLTTDGSVVTTEERFTALWQAAELLSRAHAVLFPLMQLEAMKQLALNIPDVQRETPKQPKKAHLYGPNGRPL